MSNYLRVNHALASLLTVVVVLVPVAISAQEYVGAERCKSCHEFEFSVWSRGPHVHADKALTKGQLGDNKCNTCHTTSVTERTLSLAGIQCERCHGPGQHYHPDYVMKDRELASAVGLVKPAEADCKQCHTAGTPSIRPFNFSEMWAQIDHGKTARLAWEKSRVEEKKP